MPSNLLLLLPLLSGYLFVHFCHRFYYRAQALEGHRLIFETAVAGFIGYVPCRLLVLWLSRLDGSDRWHDLWYRVAGPVPHLSTLVAMLLVAPLLALVLNLRSGFSGWRKLDAAVAGPLRLSNLLAISNERALTRAIRRSGNALQVLLCAAAKRSRVDLATVCLTLRDRKVYVGWITKSPNLRTNDTYVSLVPLLSGHRDKDTLRLKLDTEYPMDLYWTDDDLRPDEFVVAVPIAEITSARLFDIDLYLNRFSPAPVPGEHAGPATPPAVPA